MIELLKTYFLKKRQLIYAYLILLVFICFPISHLFLSISTISLSLFFFIDSKESLLSKWREIKKNRVVHLYILLLLCQILGLLYTDNLAHGIKRINTMLPLLLLPAIIFSEKFPVRYFEQMMKYLLIFIFFYFTSLIVNHTYIEGRPMNVFALYALNENLGISQFYMVFILLAPLLLKLNKLLKGENILLNGLTSIALIILIFFMTNKTSILLVIVGIILEFINVYRNKSFLFKALSITLILLMISVVTFSFPPISKRIDTILKTTDFDIEIIKTKNKVTVTKNTLEHRLLINYISIKEIFNNPIFGVGTGDYQDVLNKRYKEINFKLGILKNFNNHNQYIEEFLKTGLFGGLVFIILMFKLLNVNFYRYPNYFSLVVMFSLACFLESYLDRQHGVMIFCFFLPVFFKYDSFTLLRYMKSKK